MAYENLAVTSLFGRRMGLQPMSSGQTGSGRSGSIPDFIVGPEAIRARVSTSESTGTQLPAFGVSLLTTGLVSDSSAVFRLDPPIPSVEKTIVWGSTTIGTMSAKIWVTISTGIGQFQTSAGSSFSVVASSAGACLKLVGVTTAIYAVISGSTASGFSYTTTT